jgi:hypothetical protein
MYHLPGGAEQEKKEKGRTCDRSLTRNFRNFPKLRPKLCPKLPSFSITSRNCPNLPDNFRNVPRLRRKLLKLPPKLSLHFSPNAQSLSIRAAQARSGAECLGGGGGWGGGSVCSHETRALSG